MICEQHGTIARLVALLRSGATSEGAREVAEILRCITTGRDDKITTSVLVAVRREGMHSGKDAPFALSDEFPELHQGMSDVVAARLDAAVEKAIAERGQVEKVQLAIHEAQQFGLQPDKLDNARHVINTISAARAEATAARKARQNTKKSDERRLSVRGDSPDQRTDLLDHRGDAGDAKDVRSSKSSGTKVKKEAITDAAKAGDAKLGACASQGQATAGPPSAAMTLLLDAQQHLRELELAAAAARRSRQDAAKKRATSGSLLTPSLRRAYSKQQVDTVTPVVDVHPSLGTPKDDGLLNQPWIST